jgi:4-amino-4-deoxy-L-arabinose transferase-like glycosyltransferase
MLKKISEWVLKNEWIILLGCLVILIRIPSWFEPYWYGDEAIYLTIGQALNKGVRLYSQIHDNKPPLLYFMAALAGGNLFWFKFLATVWNLITVVVFVNLAKKLTVNKPAWITASLIFALATSWPKLEGNIANAELFFLLPTIACVNLLWKKEPEPRRIILAGITAGIAILFKVPAIFELMIWPILWLVFGEKRWFKNSVLLAIGVAIPIGLSAIYCLGTNSLNEYLVAAWKQNIPYLSSWTTVSTAKGIWLLKNRAAILVSVLAIIFGLGKKWGKNATLISAWAAVALFAALLSGRPYPHYLLQAVPALTLAISGLVFEKIPVKLIQGGVLALFGATIIAFGFYNYKTVDYYRNFLEWAVGNRNDSDYVSWFGQQNKVNYEVAAWVKRLALPEDRIFVWGDEPMIYALTKRLPASKYIVKYHIKDFRAENFTMTELAEKRPAVVVSYGNEAELPGLDNWLNQNYQPEKRVDGIVIYSLKN